MLKKIRQTNFNGERYVNHIKQQSINNRSINKNKIWLRIMSQRKSIADSVKKHILWKQQYKCKICETKLDNTFELDHAHPLFSGGTNEINNLQILCARCHRWKSKLERGVYVRRGHEITCTMCGHVFSPWFKHVCDNWKPVVVHPSCMLLSDKWKHLG